MLSKSKIFFYFCLSFILGIFISRIYNFSDLFKIGIFIVGVILFSVFFRQKKVMVAGLCLVSLVLGIWRYQIAMPKIGENNLQFYNDRGHITFQGIISDEPDVRINKINFTVSGNKMQEARSKTRDVSGKVLVSAERYPEYKYGDEIKVTCKLKTPAVFDNFSYKDYLARYGIYSVCYYPDIKLISHNHGNPVYAFLFKTKERFENSVNLILPEPQASFLAGLLLGAKRGIPKNLMNAFSTTGLTHIIALSGYNITIIAALILTLTKKIPRKTSFTISVMAIIAFVILTGASASVVRAAIMGILVLLALNVGRISDIKNAIVAAGVVMLLINPKVLAFDIGFQLSFLATIGIVYISPILEKWFKFIPNALEFRNSILLTLSAQFMTLPIIVHSFEKLSLIAPLANTLVLPIIPLTMLLGFIAGIGGLLWTILGKILAYPAWLLLTYEIKVAEFLANPRYFPYASIEIKDIWVWWIVIYYVVVCGLLIWMRSRKRYGYGYKDMRRS